MSRRRPILLLAFSLLTLPSAIQAADAAPAPSAIQPRPPVREPDRLIHPWQEGDWKGKLPSDWSTPGPEIQVPTDHMGGIITIKNVSDPVLAYFAPATSSTAPATPAKGIIICPGGGYNILAWDHEGTEVATFLSARGYHAWVLKYRLPRPGNLDPVRHLPALQDAQRSISVLRSQAESYKLDPSQLGIMGFSAGGHLSAITSTSGNNRSYAPLDAIDKTSCRPDFCALIYPAYLFHDDKNEGLAPGPDAPPAFLCHSANDGLTYRNSSSWFDALQSHQIRSELHIFPDGGHGYGMRSPLSPKAWPELLAAWMATK